MLADGIASAMVQVWVASTTTAATDLGARGGYIQTARDKDSSDDAVVMAKFSLSDGQRVSA